VDNKTVYQVVQAVVAVLLAQVLVLVELQHLVKVMLVV
jgi:hypothetical protein